ncbi:hypothetical protein ES705_43639 [subsurface metagenome]
MGNPVSLVDSGGIHLNMYHHVISEQVGIVLDDTTNSQALAYTQALTGPQILIEFPTLEDIREEFGYNVIINKAELILPVNQELYDEVFYTSPSNLGLYDNVTKYFLIDDGLILNYFGGVLDNVNYQYMFNVGNHIHEYMQGGADTLFSKKFILFPSKVISPVEPIQSTPGRLVLNGGSSDNPPRLKIIYSEIPE